MNLGSALRTARGHLLGHYRRPLPAAFSEPLRGAKGLEIGGPSAVFGAAGLLAVYPLLRSLDGVQPSAQTHWHDLDAAAGYVVDGRRRGELHIAADVELAFAPDGVYDLVLCSHVLEHIANPLRALAQWRRVTVAGGHLLIVAPHLEGTFDHRRPVTALAHMRADLKAGVGEDDLTHVDEFLALHDASRNAPWTAGPEFEPRIRDNASTRLMHHHTFTTLSLIDLLEHAGIEVMAAQARLPHDIYVLGRWTDAPPAAFEVAQRAARRSPFARDRLEARGRR